MISFGSHPMTATMKAHDVELSFSVKAEKELFAPELQNQTTHHTRPLSIASKEEANQMQRHLYPDKTRRVPGPHQRTRPQRRRVQEKEKEEEEGWSSDRDRASNCRGPGSSRARACVRASGRTRTPPPEGTCVATEIPRVNNLSMGRAERWMDALNRWKKPVL